MDVLIFPLKGGDVRGAVGVDVLNGQMPYLQCAAQPLIGQLGLLNPLGHQIRELVEVFIQQRAARGEPDAPADPEEELYIQFLFQGNDVFAQGGLGDIQGGGGKGEVQTSGRLQEAVDLHAVHVFPPPKRQSEGARHHSAVIV